MRTIILILIIFITFYFYKKHKRKKENSLKEKLVDELKSLSSDRLEPEEEKAESNGEEQGESYIVLTKK